MREKMIYVCKMIILFLIIVFLGFLCMLITYSLPNKSVKANIESSIGTFKEEGRYVDLIREYDGTQLDNFTDAIMLNELYYEDISHSILNKAMAVYANYSADKDPIVSLINVTEHLPAFQTIAYPRYWHGNLIFLKPLFMFLDYSSIKILNCFFQMLVVLLVLKLMLKNHLNHFILPFMMALFLINPIAIALSLQFYPMFYMTMFALIVLLQFQEKIFKNQLLPYYFLVIGMLTSYFDFLTYPLITLGIPLTFVLLLDQNAGIYKNIKRILLYSLIWGLGYVGMWAAKWIIGSIVLKENLLKNAYETIIARSSPEDFTRFDAIKYNLLIYKKKIYLWIFICIAIYYFIKIYIHRKEIDYPKCIQKILPFVIISMMPFAWYFFASNHSFIHFWFTYRSLMIFFFAMMASIEVALSNK